MTERAPAPLSDIMDCKLVDGAGNETLSQTLWETQPVIFLLIRRPGCVLCRADARRMWALKESFDALGIRPVCLVHEWLKSEIAAFKPAFWQGDVFLDKDKLLFRALGGGKVNKQSWCTFFCNMCTVFKKFDEAEKDILPEGSNTNGTHMTMGGMIVVKAGNKGIQYMFSENFWGDRPPLNKVLEQCEAATGGTLTQDQVDTQMQTIRLMCQKYQSFKA